MPLSKAFWVCFCCLNVLYAINKVDVTVNTHKKNPDIFYVYYVVHVRVDAIERGLNRYQYQHCY